MGKTALAMGNVALTMGSTYNDEQHATPHFGQRASMGIRGDVRRLA
jgi:hypothetical protein